jgi:hypothetical protein
MAVADKKSAISWGHHDPLLPKEARYVRAPRRAWRRSGALSVRSRPPLQPRARIHCCRTSSRTTCMTPCRARPTFSPSTQPRLIAIFMSAAAPFSTQIPGSQHGSSPSRSQFLSCRKYQRLRTTRLSTARPRRRPSGTIPCRVFSPRHPRRGRCRRSLRRSSRVKASIALTRTRRSSRSAPLPPTTVRASCSPPQ